MDDDFGFGTSVWGAPDPVEPSTSNLNANTTALLPRFASSSNTLDNELDEDDGFSAPMVASADDDDDFGDFGDGVDDGDYSAFGQPARYESVEDEQYKPLQHHDWESLRLAPMPSTPALRQHLDEILAPIWDSMDGSQYLNDEDIRQVEGLGQILVTAESRQLYHTIFQASPPLSRPPNWTRSRIRRQHLTSLGVPINLDEVLPQANGKALPALQITTRPSSAPPGPRNGTQVFHPSSRSNSRSSTPKPDPPPKSSSVAQLSLGPKPELDERGIERMMALTQDNLPLLPLSTLESHLTTSRSLRIHTATLLTHLLQTREALQQDSETYNGLIAELVGEAQKMKTGTKIRAGKRGSGIS